MRVVYVDSDEQEAEGFRKTAGELEMVEKAYTFSKEQEAVSFFLSARADVALVDVSDTDQDGIALVERLKKMQPNLPVIVTSRYASYALQAFEADADGYLLKPFGSRELEKQLKKMETRYHIRKEPSVYFRTMPRFDLLVDGALVPIRKKKVKELLALLVDFAGNSLTCEQAIAYLWEDRPEDAHTKALFRVTAMRLRELLHQEKIDFILREKNGVRLIDMERVSSDYYQMLAGVPEAISRYHGEYMSEYSWAEMSNARLGRIAEKSIKE